VTITLNIDDELVERARKVAEQRGISLEAILGAVMQKIATDDRSGLDGLLYELDAHPDGRRWSRKALYRY